MLGFQCGSEGVVSSKQELGTHWTSCKSISILLHLQHFQRDKTWGNVYVLEICTIYVLVFFYFAQTCTLTVLSLTVCSSKI